MINYKNNNPIQDTNEDLLNRSPRAQALAEHIREKFKEFEEAKKDPKNQSSYNIAIIGAWGEGKTSFINLLKKELEEPQAKNWFYKFFNKLRKLFPNNKGIEIKEFDPWYFPDKCDIHDQFFSILNNRTSYLIWWLIFYLILTIPYISGWVDYLFKLPLLKEILYLIQNFINKFINNLKATYLFPLVIVSCYSIIRPYHTKNLISKWFAFLSIFTSSLIDLCKKDEFEPFEVKKELRKLTDGRKLVVVIDNIDRLYPIQIKKIFDLVKGIGDLPNIIYILAFDKQLVSKALNKEDIEEASKYLDKFIQYPVSLHTTYKEHVIKVLAEAFPDQQGLEYYTEKLSSYITNIRELKILINTLKESYKLLEENVIFHELLYITAIGLQNYGIYYHLSKSKEILCSAAQEQDEKLIDKLTKLKEEIDNFKPSPVLWRIILDLFPRMRSVEKENNAWNNNMLLMMSRTRLKAINNYHYFDIYFQISFPDHLVCDEDFNSLVAGAGYKDKLSKLLLKLLKPVTEEEKQKIPNSGIHSPFKWLDNLTERIVEQDNINNLSNWLLSLAEVTEEYADEIEDANNKWQVVFSFTDFLEKFAQLLQKEDPASANDHDTPPIYAFLRTYLIEAASERQVNYMDSNRIAKLRDVVINNITKYSESDNISQLSYFRCIIRFASSNLEKHDKVVSIIKESLKQNDALLKFIKYFITEGHDGYTIKEDFECYISYDKAITRLELTPDESKEHDIKLYISILSKQSNTSFKEPI